MSWLEFKAQDSDDRASQYGNDAANSRTSALGAAAMGDMDRASQHVSNAHHSDFAAQGAQNEAEGYRNA